MPDVSMTVNGRAVRGTVEGRTLLVEYLREASRLRTCWPLQDTSP